VLPWEVTRQLAGYLLTGPAWEPPPFDAWRFCRACEHNATLHTLRNRKPWLCGRPGCRCPGLDHELLDAWAAAWLAHRVAAATANLRPPIPEAVKAAVLARDGMVCRYCGRGVYRRRRHGPGRLHFEHVVPWSLGGRHTVDNIVVACARCNMAKHDDPSIVPPGWALGNPVGNPSVEAVTSSEQFDRIPALSFPLET
jgi:5-methylcytosine-specific restriction endonuclease McrA